MTSETETAFIAIPSYFEATDIVKVPRGQTIESSLVESGYGFLIDRHDLLVTILKFNRISQELLRKPAQAPLLIRLNHPKLYDAQNKEHPCFAAYRNRSFDILAAAIEYGPFAQQFKNLKRRASTRLEILEVGCGTGRSMLEMQRDFPQANISGIVLPGEMPVLASTRSFFSITQKGVGFPDVVELDLNLESLEKAFGPKKFDFIYSQATLRYVRDKIKFLEAIQSRLRPDGFAVVDVAMLRICSRDGTEITLDLFFNAERDQRSIAFDRQNNLIFLFYANEGVLELGLTLESSLTTYTAPDIQAEQNAAVGWLSNYRCTN